MCTGVVLVAQQRVSNAVISSGHDLSVCVPGVTAMSVTASPQVACTVPAIHVSSLSVPAMPGWVRATTYQQLCQSDNLMRKRHVRQHKNTLHPTNYTQYASMPYVCQGEATGVLGQVSLWDERQHTYTLYSSSASARKTLGVVGRLLQMVSKQLVSMTCLQKHGRVWLRSVTTAQRLPLLVLHLPAPSQLLNRLCAAKHAAKSEPTAL